MRYIVVIIFYGGILFSKKSFTSGIMKSGTEKGDSFTPIAATPIEKECSKVKLCKSNALIMR